MSNKTGFFGETSHSNEKRKADESVALLCSVPSAALNNDFAISPLSVKVVESDSPTEPIKNIFM